MSHWVPLNRVEAYSIIKFITDAASRTPYDPYDIKTGMFTFLYTSHDGLSVVVVVGGECSSQRHTHCELQQLIREQHVICYVSQPRHGKNL